MARPDRPRRHGRHATGRRTADVAIDGGRITAVEDALPRDADAREIDATGLLVLPGVIDVHTHTRVATDDQPDRFFQDSVAAAFGGTTTFLSFNNPGTGSQQTGSLPTTSRRGGARRTRDSAVDYAVSLVLQPTHRELEREIPAAIDAGVPTFKAFMVYDFALPELALERALRATADHAGLLEIHGEDQPGARSEHRQIAGRGQDGASLPRRFTSAVRRG